MKKRIFKVLLGLLALLFCAGQALAVPAAPSSLVMPPTPDVDGVYKLAWYSVSGCNYVLQESKDGGAWTTIYSGSNTYIYPPKRALGTYAYQVKAVNSTGSSLWKAGATTVTVGATTAQTTAPTYLNVPAATSTSATKISFGGAALGATYVLEQAVGTSPTFTVVYTGTNGYYYTVGLVDGTTYAYRVKAKVAGYADSAYYPGTTGSTLAVAFPQGADACLACHETLTPTVASGWTASAHANPNQQPGPGVCDNCHNVANAVGAKTAQITCEACHGTAPSDHSTPGTYTIGNQLTVCNKCHEIYNTDGSVTVADHQNTVSDTHFDNPATATVVEGYAIRKGGVTPCSDCHGHQAKSAIHTEWAASAHAGRLTAATPDTARVWGHYNWDATFKADGVTKDRADCQRCHTATGVSNFLTNPLTYVSTGNNFSHLSGWAANTGSGQNELLYCWGCHSNVENGTLRNPGTITNTYAGSPSGSPAVTVTFPDVSKSNVCVACHLGVESGAVIQASTGDFSNLGFINSHYLAAGGMVFNESGYEYAGQTYNTYGFHKQVGVANAYNTGSDGPCVTCHMTSSEAHSFEVVAKNAAGAVTAITSSECAKCHGGLTATVLEKSKSDFNLAMDELKAALLAKGIEFSTAYPYFYVAGTTTAFKNWSGVSVGGTTGHGKDVMGAAFNYNLIEHDPGAYAHNRGYALKLIADSCDYLADGSVDGNGTSAALRAIISSTTFSDTTSWAAATHPSETTCSGCHLGINTTFATSQHKTREGKKTFYNDHLNDGAATELQKGFGNYVTVAYSALPCGACHNANDNGPWDTNPALGTNVQAYPGPNCLDCHTNRPNGLGGAFANTTATSASAPVLKQTCYGCHSRQVNEVNAGLTDVHFAKLGCSGCHATSDMHGNGTASATQLEHGTITAQCENCHGDGKAQGPLSTIGEHMQHQGDIACSTCHTESMITCHNCHFDNEYGAPGTTKAKFASGTFGGSKASGKSWRFLLNRVMPDGSTKVYPGSMQSLVADYTAKEAPSNTDDGIGHTHAGIAPYYSHSITKVNALRCSDCHGIQNAIDLAAGKSIRFNTWNAAAGVAVPATSLGATWTPPKGIIPVPENPTGKILMDFVDLKLAGTQTSLSSTSDRVLFQKDGPDTIHMPEAYVKPLTALQIQKLADAQFNHTSPVATTSTPSTGFTGNTCNGCHAPTNTLFTSSLHYSRQGKETFYNHNVGNAAAPSLQKGFGNYVTVGYTALPCADCHNAAAWTPAGGSDTWVAENGGNPVCTDCHTNKVAGVATTAFDAPVTKNTCIGCHSRQATETALGLTDVHTGALLSGGGTLSFTCPTCHASSDLHGDGTARASQLAAGAVSAKCENCHTTMAASTTPEHTTHLANIACSTCHMESVITCYGCHFDNEASNPADATILHAKFASGKFGGTVASGKSWRFLVNRVMSDGSTKVYPASMQSLVADRTASNAPGEDNQGWTHAAIAPYYSHSITKVNALRCDKCHGIQKAIDLNAGLPVRVVKWNAAPGVAVPVGSMMATYTAPSGVIPVPENPAGKLLMDFVDLVNPAAGPLNASGTSPSDRVLFKADGPDTIHMPEAYVKPLTAAQIQALATPQVRP